MMLRRTITILGVLVLTGFGWKPAYAGPIAYTFDGTVDFADDGNAFGLIAGDTISGTAFVPDALGVGDEFLTLDDGLEVSFTIGTRTFSTEDDLAEEFPLLEITNGEVTFLDFFGELFGSSFELVADLRTASDPNWRAVDYVSDPEFALVVGGTLSATRVPVPEPATLSLLAMGFVSLLASRIRRRRTAIPTVSMQRSDPSS